MSLEWGQLRSLMSLKVTGYSEWELWAGWGLWVLGAGKGIPAHSEDMGPDLGQLRGAGTGTCLGMGW